MLDRCVLEVALDPFGLPLNAARVPGSGLHELQLGPRGRQLRDGLLQACIGHLVGVEFGAVAGQVEDFDLLPVLGPPCFDRLAVMHPQVVQDQVDLAPGVLDEPAREVDQDAGVECAAESLRLAPSSRIFTARRRRSLSASTGSVRESIFSVLDLTLRHAAISTV